jgi:uncharacterized membrane protein
LKIVAAICNVVWFAFTCLVLVTDGLPKEAGYILLSLLHLLTPLLTLVVLFRSGTSDGWLGLLLKRKAIEEQVKVDSPSSMSTAMSIVAIVWNIALLGFLCWALVSQPPHPEEEGFVAFVVISVLTPILSVVAILGSGASDGWLGLLRRRKA